MGLGRRLSGVGGLGRGGLGGADEVKQGLAFSDWVVPGTKARLAWKWLSALAALQWQCTQLWTAPCECLFRGKEHCNSSPLTLFQPPRAVDMVINLEDLTQHLFLSVLSQGTSTDSRAGPDTILGVTFLAMLFNAAYVVGV